MTRVKKQPAALHEDLEVVMGCMEEALVSRLGGREPELLKTFMDPAREALAILCQKAEGCGKFDPKKLAQCLRPMIGYRNVKKLREPLRYGKDTKATLQLKDLHQMQILAERLKDLILKVNRTPFAAYLRQAGPNPYTGIKGLLADDLMFGNLNPLLKSADARVAGIVPNIDVIDVSALERELGPIHQLLDRYSEYRDLATASMDKHLRKLCDYVEASTGSAHDDEIVSILVPLGISHAKNADQLKTWRSRSAKSARKA